MTAGESNSSRQHRVLLAADAGSYSVTTVNLAVAMAASVKTQLQGLFIEDEDLLQVTGLPCSREITLITATERPLSADQMLRSLQLAARQFEQTLQREAQALQVSWSCETVRGRVSNIGALPRAQATFTIFARPAVNRMPVEKLQGARKVLVLGSESGSQQQVLTLLLRRPGHDRVELSLCADDGDNNAGVFDVRTLSGQFPQSEIRLVDIPRSQLLARLAQAGSAFDYAIISRREFSEDLLPILGMLRCTVILVD